MSGDETAEWRVILLHGYDDDPAVFEIPAAELAAAGWPTRVPKGPITLDNGRSAWFETVDGEPDPVQLRAAIEKVDAAVDASGASLEHTVVAGFSQGAALALAWLLEAGEHPVDRSAVGGVVAIAPWLPDADGLTLDPARAAGVPIFIGHGTDDEVVPLPLGRGAARMLERQGATVEFLELDEGHALAPFVASAREWLTSLAGRATGPS